MPRYGPLTLSRAQFLYIAIILFVVLPGIMGVAFSGVLYSAWCRQVEMPKYEKLLGFRMGLVRVQRAGAESYSVDAITWVRPDGSFARAGIRAGDVPHMHHGFGDLCGDLASVAESGHAELEVANVEGMRNPQASRRRVTVELPSSEGR
jgi:hypothetical protein